MIWPSTTWALPLVPPHAFVTLNPVVQQPPEVSVFQQALANGNVSAIRQLSQQGQLARLIPGWERVTGPANYQHLGHDYRLDEHMLHAVAYARQSGWFGLLTPRQQVVVTMATLVHDIRKQTGTASERLTNRVQPDPHHPKAGAEWAMQYLPGLGFSTDETALMAWLLDHHTDIGELTRWAEYHPQSPAIPPVLIAQLAKTIATKERLWMLLALTEGDIKAVRRPEQTLWTPDKQQTMTGLANALLALL
jgi:[protein-PII] uridylyltransferase